MGDGLVVKTKIAGGVVAGPVFVGVFTALGARRAGYDWRRHAASSLAVGRGGWGQRANFMLAGGLYCVAGRGLARSSSRVVGPAVVPVLVFAAGVGLIGSGAFVTDPVAGPARAPCSRRCRRNPRARANAQWPTTQPLRNPDLRRSPDWYG
jgi:hypothetical protein